MSDISEPLLPEDNAEARARDDDIVRRLEEGLSADDPVDFEELLRLKPDQVIKYLSEKGTRKLGTFITEDTEVLPLMKGGTLWTFGSDKQDIDFEHSWRNYLANDNFKAKGFSSKVEAEAHVVSLRNAALDNDRGVINPLLEKWQDGSVSTRVFGLPVVHAVIQFKWDKWARRVLLYELCAYLLWLLSFQVFIFLFQDEDLNLSLSQLWHRPNGVITIISLMLSLIGMTPFIYIEACTLAEYGPSRWLGVWNAIDLCTYVLQVVISIAYLGRWQLHSDAISILAAIQVLLLWVRIQYFARAFQSMGNSFVNTLAAVVTSVRSFLMLLLITLWGFAGAYYILYRDEQGTTKFDNPWHALTSVFTLMMGDIDVDLFYNSKKPVIGILLLWLFLFVMTMVLLNLLIALMSDAAAKASDDDGTKFLCSKAELIDELESSLPRWLRSDDWYPPYIHILKVNPASGEKVLASDLWTLGGAADVGEQEEDSGDDLKETVEGLRSEIGELKSMLRDALQSGISGSGNGGGGGSTASGKSLLGSMLPASISNAIGAETASQ